VARIVEAAKRLTYFEAEDDGERKAGGSGAEQS
jgi:hypothetical protein